MSNLVPTKRNNGTTRPSNLATFAGFPSWIDELFNKNFGTEFMSNFNTGITLPSVNIKDNADNFEVHMAVPGFDKKDFDINVDNHILSISAENKVENEHEEANFTRREFGYSNFRRSFTLPETVDTDKISATYKDGILNVMIPKLEEAKKKPMRSIEVS
ncbi:MAG: Hsp20/alpha crystallin family protein [Mangrovimonas sp.]|nr:Hsp20/alpha crystallin family protein [Mangrovimonas sp.]HRV55004.1 Hsp20/alpha crystallin family protein [Mangrovimonas sp.]